MVPVCVPSEEGAGEIKTSFLFPSILQSSAGGSHWASPTGSQRVKDPADIVHRGELLGHSMPRGGEGEG